MEKPCFSIRLMAMLCAAALLVAACGGGSGGGGGGVQVPYNGSTTQAEISQSSVIDAMQSINDFIPICSTQ